LHETVEKTVLPLIATVSALETMNKMEVQFEHREFARYVDLAIIDLDEWVTNMKAIRKCLSDRNVDEMEPSKMADFVDECLE